MRISSFFFSSPMSARERERREKEIIFHKFLQQTFPRYSQTRQCCSPRENFPLPSPRLSTPRLRSHGRNCCTSYKCISPAHSFHASANPPRKVPRSFPLPRVLPSPGRFFFAGAKWRKRKVFSEHPGSDLYRSKLANVRVYSCKSAPEKYDDSSLPR